MKIFFIYIFRILLVSFVVMTLIEKITDYGLKSIQGSIFNDWEKLLEGKINSDLVILGSSRGSVGYDPILIGGTLNLSAFNLSFNGGPQNLQYAKFDLYLKKNKIPEVIIQNVDVNHFSTSKSIPDPFQFLPVSKDSDLRKKISEIDSLYFKYSFIPLFKYNKRTSLVTKGILSFLGFEYHLFQTQNGYTPVFQNFIPDDHNLDRMRNIKGEISLEDYRNGIDQTFSYYKNNIPLSTQIFFVWAPEHTIRKEINPEIMQAFKNEILARSKEMPNAFFLDFSEDSISQDSKFFYDTFHLNTEGSSLFSRKLSESMKQYLAVHAF